MFIDVLYVNACTYMDINAYRYRPVESLTRGQRKEVKRSTVKVQTASGLA